MKIALVGILAGLGLLTAAPAHAAALTPDYAQPPNGAGVDPGHNLTPVWSPIQVPALDDVDTASTTTITAHPYLAPWAHERVPIPAGTAVELRGAARVRIPEANGKTLVVNPNGHCYFDGPNAVSGDLTPTALTPVRIDTSAFQLTIEPTLYRH
ncbi:hypothetical protein [Nocardia pseudobrasiliensis]|uniref:Uncharacterized protein n=1 Tax=Nocardia pseudobrasiliensis TaxID=45979 RepID=A0A370IAZ5_9NOCA|nr:hypothetical protein [Nocardia pseudobrasiliensis]RDI67893.1 hypothetical protein DFR76_102294 [Nocardia pseudobrasiliensis]